MLLAAWPFCVGHTLAEVFVIEFNRLVLVLQTLLQLINLQLKPLFFLLVFGFEREDLVIGLLSLIASANVVLIGMQGFFLNVGNLPMQVEYAVLSERKGNGCNG